MKRQYIEPEVIMMEMADEELICLSTSETEVSNASVMQTKERENVNFADEIEW